MEQTALHTSPRLARPFFGGLWRKSPRSAAHLITVFSRSQSGLVRFGERNLCAYPRVNALLGWSGHSGPLACTTTKVAGKSARSTRALRLPRVLTISGKKEPP